MAVDDDRGIRFVSHEHEVDRLAHGRHLLVLERAFGIERRVPGGEQQPVAIR